MGKAAGQRQKGRYLAYETVVSVILGLTFGTVLFDRGAIGFLSPFIVADLRLTNAQLGLAASIISLTWAIGGFFVGRASDTAGRRKPFLIAAVTVFSLCSAATGLVGGFATLIAVRLVMGMAEGPVPPLGSALLLGASGDHRRGLNVGIYAFFAGLVGSVLAPVVLVGLANQFGWRATFLLAGLPGLALVLAIAFGLSENTQSSGATIAPERSRPTFDLLRVRNIGLGAVIATLLMACMVVILIFLPLYLVQVRRLSPLDMSLVMTALGVATLATSLMLPALSDRLGRKTVMAGFAGLGAILPLGCFFWTGSPTVLAVVCAFGALPGALLPVAIGIIPGESVLPRDRGAALGLVMGAAELFGGFITPSLAGVLADHSGLGAALALAGGCAVAAALLSLLLRETAPRLAAVSNPLGAALETS